MILYEDAPRGTSQTLSAMYTPSVHRKHENDFNTWAIRLAVWLLEVLVEGLLLGVLLGALTLSNFIGLLPGVWALGLMVGVVLFLNGYYVTKTLFGLVWRGQKSWLYPGIAATIFVIHMYVFYMRAKPDMPGLPRVILPFQVGGACIVFACTFVSGWFLRKWIGQDPLP